jgi:hypothetical protein
MLAVMAIYWSKPLPRSPAVNFFFRSAGLRNFGRLRPHSAMIVPCPLIRPPLYHPGIIRIKRYLQGENTIRKFYRAHIVNFGRIRYLALRDAAQLHY